MLLFFSKNLNTSYYLFFLRFSEKGDAIFKAGLNVWPLQTDNENKSCNFEKFVHTVFKNFVFDFKTNYTFYRIVEFGKLNLI